jgi:hypothetical protein
VGNRSSRADDPDRVKPLSLQPAAARPAGYGACAGRGGSPIVWLNSALAPLTVIAAARAATMTWFIALQGGEAADPEAGQTAAVWAMRNQRPFAPVHMRAKRRADGGIDLSWMRCARLGGDVWGPVEPPLEPGGESYRVDVVAAGQFKRA